MSSSNAWAEFAGVFCRTRSAFLEHENAKAELKDLMPEDAKEGIGHGIRTKRSKSRAVSFDVPSVEAVLINNLMNVAVLLTRRPSRRRKAI